MRAWAKVLLVVVLIALPFAVRWFWFHRGWYAPPVIPEVDESQIAVAPREYHPVAYEALQGGGRVLIDLSHQNNLEVDDLTPLRDRLAERGVAVETFDGLTGSLGSRLRGITAMIVVAPTISYAVEERETVVDFVEDGGRLLLGADPTRPIPPTEEEEADLLSILLPDSAIPAINSLADAFGVVYFDDYLYNLVDNDGNYRNVKFTTFSDEQDLTEDLEMVIFFATHSLQSDGLSLVSGDENTLSPLRSGETELTAAALAADERVLALGDITFLTAPYHTVADNDRFLNNIADWLATAEREWDLQDFPYLFRGPVDLVQVAGDFLDPRVIANTGVLEEVFDQAGLTLNVRGSEDPDNDTLFVGTFEHAEVVQDYLDTAGVTIALVEEEEGTPATEEADEEEARDTIEVEELGTILAQGTTLFAVGSSADRVVVAVLAEDGDAVIEAVRRLILVDFTGCIHTDTVTICSTGEVEEGLGLDISPEEPEEPEEEEITPAERPTIGSPSESQLALLAGTPWLEELAEESYDETSQAGETYTYTILMESSQDVMWVYGWCTATQEQLIENWENIAVIFTLDIETVPLDSFAMLEETLDEKECRLYYALLTDWPAGEHLVTTEVTFETELDDGFDVYPAGTHAYEYRVTVGS